MRMKKESMATLGLLFITIWSALQYVLLESVTEAVSTFSFIFLTNLVGLVVLAAAQFKKLKLITKKTLLIGMLLALELVGFNAFLLMGSRGIDPVIVSSLSAMDFLFIPPLLLLLRKKVSFRSAVASIVAVISLLLMFNADIDLFFTSANVLFLFLSDFFFAVYVITISMIGEKENASALTISQMAFSILFGLAGWFVETGIGIGSFSLPDTALFWITVLFFGIFIRALYGLIQVICQKYVKPINASLIFSSEIIITLIASPVMSRIMHTAYTKATLFQILGCFLFVIAVLVADDTFMEKFGYKDMETKTYLDEKGVERTQNTVARKLTNMTLVLSMSALVIATIICLSSISSIKKTSIEKSTELGRSAANASEEALRSELELELTSKVNDKAAIAEEKLRSYIASAEYAADMAAALYDRPEDFVEREVLPPSYENVGKWIMQRILAEEKISYEDVRDENCMLGNLEDTFRSITENGSNIATIYIGTETGLLLSYDAGSESTDTGEEIYYDFLRESDWYTAGMNAREPFFTKAYQDEYGRGLTITCVAPIYDSAGKFRGCIGIDVLMNDINRSMVNDNIVDPNYATMIDSEGYIIASKDVDGDSSGTVSIYDEHIDSPLRGKVADTVLSNDKGIVQAGEGKDAIYVSYASIPLTDWSICIMSPVSNIIRPAVEMRENINNNTEIVADTVNQSIRRIISACLVIFAVLILVVTYFVGKLAGRISKPLGQLEEDVVEISRGNLDRRTYVSTDDEIGSLARAFNSMTESLQTYIQDIKDMTAEEERIASELSVATKIQADMLPANFDLGREDMRIYASMRPAKEVGGDFYDFFFTDDDHIALVIADVSGKGVPAALFMMISKMLIKNAAQNMLSPKEIFEKVNKQLCENNEAEMFVTAWIGIIEISTGIMRCANAGHEYPAVKHRDGQFTLYKDKHGLVLAGMEFSKYREYEIQLSAGDRIFVYTDGVPEATNGEEELYGTDRMVEALNKAEGATCEELLEHMQKEIDAFVGTAPQFDDITMLCYDFKGKEAT